MKCEAELPKYLAFNTDDECFAKAKQDLFKKILKKIMDVNK